MEISNFKYQMSNSVGGFMLVEVILSVALLAIITLGSIGAIVFATAGAQISGENFRATQLAEEGLETVRAMHDDDPFNLKLFDPGINYGIGVSNNVATIAANQDTISDGTITFTRTINFSTISATESGVTSTVTWNESPTRTGSVSLQSYFTNWKSLRGGLFVYGTTSPSNKTLTRTFDTVGNSFSNAVQLLSAAANGNVRVRTSPIRNEALVGVTDSSGNLTVYCYDGNAWDAEFTASLGTATTRRFDLTYSANGDAMVVYAKGTSALYARRKGVGYTCNANQWSAETSIGNTITTGTVAWIRVEGSPVGGSKSIAVAWNDANSDLGAAVWNGSWSFPSGALETNLDTVSAAGDSQDFDIAFETKTGNLLVAWGKDDSGGSGCSSNCMGYSRYTGSWSAAGNINVADSGTNVDLSANPSAYSNEVIMAAVDSGPKNANRDDTSIAYWSGSAWTTNSNVDTNSGDPVAGTKLVATGWVKNGSTTRSIVVYMDASGTGISWFACNGGSCSLQTDYVTSPAIGNPKKWIDIQSDPFNQNTLITTISDTNNDVWAKMLTMTSSASFSWSNLEGGSALDANLQQSTASPMGFAYWRNL